MRIMIYDGVECVISLYNVCLHKLSPSDGCQNWGETEMMGGGVCDAIENKSGWMVFAVECEKWRFGEQRNFWGEDMDRPNLDEFGGNHVNMIMWRA